MLDDFMIRAALAGAGVALASGPLGCFVVWRRMAYFGEATAHAAVLGVALALALSAPILPAVVLAAVLMASAVTLMRGRGYAMDTALGVMAHTALAAGLVAVSLLADVRLDLMAFLFGDILAVSRSDLAVIWGGGALVLGLTLWRWSDLLIATLNPDLAHAAGVDPRRAETWLTLALAVVVAVAIKVVGVLLIAALLVIPAAAARPLSGTPEGMALGAAGIGGLSALAGLYGAYLFDTPAGPSIVCVAALSFIVTTLARGLVRGR
ncbi:metal ABC transporter permease [Ruegeria pomeroyi]|uniref:High-affinity zinc uptake system membrane protein ZnuB n=2 Tax=Ruegeria TaxID=97050 RepID=A0A9Q3WI53_9RHOB|nr:MULTISPECIES: metal ABC transporter permease [Ruegeria]MCE8509966.1 metal ABC transporter permease [Ruegeria pomeroyi]MCE8513014.1 metal ABC transporter permease [Ruegeria pomeroyi]MCE8516124.1 metal ABC transporter permease [Ruegeria pomeroyi]MCE8521934.1 metal ABC transporter permease [Ruegeria pomeroyi]MCE8529521.1 metal ABC transporter permease [Ruegeria pomeroyi]